MELNEMGRKIKQVMIEANFKQSDLAKKLGIKQSLISKWITGKLNPKVSTLKKIANATGRPLSYFFDNSTGVNGNNNIVNTGANQTVINSSDIELLKKEMEILKLQIELLKKDKKK